jgi:hypothetical protein
MLTRIKNFIKNYRSNEACPSDFVGTGKETYQMSNRNNGHHMANNSTPKNGVKITRNRNKNPFALSNMEKPKLWNPATQNYVGWQRYYTLKRDHGLDLSTLRANRFACEHPDFKGTLTDEEWLSANNIVPDPDTIKQLSVLDDDTTPTSDHIADMADEFAEELAITDADTDTDGSDLEDVIDDDYEPIFTKDEILNGDVTFVNKQIEALVAVIVAKDREITELKDRIDMLMSTNNKGEKALIEGYERVRIAVNHLTGYDDLPF